MRKFFSVLADHISTPTLLKLLVVFAVVWMAYIVAGFYFWTKKPDVASSLTGLLQVQPIDSSK